MVAKLQDLRWDDMKVLLSVARAASFSGAARTLGVTVSTVSRRVEALESALGVRLFDRTPDGVSLTPVAEGLVPLAETFERTALEVERAVDGFEAEPEGVVKLTAPPGVVAQWLGPSIGELHRAYPKLRVELDGSVDYVDLARGEADLALRAMAPTSGDLVCVKLVEVVSIVMAAPEFVADVGVLDDPASITWVGWSPELAHIPDAAWLQSVVPETSYAMRSNDYNTLLGAARAGAGALVSARESGMAAGLVELPLSDRLRSVLPPAPANALWLVGPRALRDVPRVAVVWDFCKDLFTRDRPTA